MANATSTAGAAAQVAARALRARNNENAPKFFAAGIGGIIVLYMIFHWSRCLYKRQRTGKGQASKILRIPVAISRLASRILLLKAPGFVSTGHSVVFVAYVAINLAVIFTNIDWTNLVGLSKRLGWMTVGNLAFVFVLSLKHTPLAFLISFSYERLQPLHQVAGYSTIACLFCHAIIYITAWKRSNTLHDLTENENIMGIVAGFCFLLILVLTFLRRRNYELFHLTHILLAMLVLIFSGLHRPELLTYQHSTYALIFAACIWVLDVLVRSTKLAIYRLGNGASLTPLPHGGTRIVLRKTILGATPGKHVFLHLPKIRAMELHPFTLNSVDPVEMVAVACDGFTKDLHDYAIANPEAEIAASIDGPYGSLPDFAGVGKVLFIAGGSGASFTTGVALELLKEQKSVVRKVEFVWVVRHTDQISWFAPHLLSLASDPRVSLRVHVTHHHFADTASDSVASLSAPDSITSPTTREPEKDPEKSLPMQSGSLSSEGPYTAIPGRPDVTKVVRDSVAEAGEIGEGERVMVVACGPEAMMLEVRMAVAGSLRGSGPAVEMHLESFCW